MSFEIFTDTSANLPSSFVKQNHLHIIPFFYFIDGREYTCEDASSFDGVEYYNLMRNGADVTTSQISPQVYIDSFRPTLENGEDLLFIGMSSGISGSFNCAKIAADELKDEYPDRNIYLVDTLGASLGEGLPVIKAVEYRKKGLPVKEITTKLKSFCKRIYQVFTVDNLMYLRKHGRLSNVVATVGTLLHIKPILKGDSSGKIVAFGKARGKRKAIEALAEKYDALVENPQNQTVGIAHADCPEDAEYLAQLLKRNNPPKEIVTVCYEPVTGSHVGPGTLALFFLSDDEARLK